MFFLIYKAKCTSKNQTLLRGFFLDRHWARNLSRTGFVAVSYAFFRSNQLSNVEVLSKFFGAFILQDAQ